MKKIILVLTILCLYSMEFNAQNIWKHQYPFLDVSYINSFFLNDTIGWANIYLDSKNGTNDLFLFKTTDGGENWLQIYSFNPSYKLWGKVQFVNENVGFISVGTDENRYLYKSTNGGVTWYVILSPQSGNPKKFYFLNENVGFVHGQNPNSNGIFRTSNGGQSWNYVHGFADETGFIKDFTFYGPNNGWLIISYLWYDEFYRTNNSGQNWTSYYPNFSFRLSQLKFLTQSDGYLMSNRWQILKSSDAGTNWSTFYNNSNITSFDSFIALGLDTIFAVGQTGYTPFILRTTNGGQQWNMTPFNQYSRFVSVTAFTKDKIYIPVIGLGPNGGSAHLIIKYNDYTIEEYPLGLKHKMIGGFSSTENRIAIGYKLDHNLNKYESIILQGPPNWHIKNIYPNQKFTTLFFKDNMNGFIAANRFINNEESVIYFTSDMGSTLTPVFTMSLSNINSIVFENEFNGYAVGHDGLFIKTTNGGISWEQQASFSQENLNYIKFNSNMGFVCSEEGNIFITTDNGNLWVEKNVGRRIKLNNIAVKDSNIIYVVGDSGAVFHSIDQGDTWTDISFSDDYNFNFIVFHSTRFGRLFGGKNIDNSTVIFETTNGGISWTENSTSITKSINSAFSIEPFQEWAVGDNGTIINNNYFYIPPVPVELTSFTAFYSSPNVQLTWSTATELNNHGFEIERSFDKTNWATIGFKAEKGTTSEPQQYSYSDNLSDIASTKFYYRLKQIDFNGSFEYSEIVEVEIAPTKFSLSQNYPNPFNPSTKISWQSPVSSWQTLKVYDILGNEVAALVNEYRDAGSYEVEFQSAVGSLQLASGIYYYQLRAVDPSTGSGQIFVETKKMILLK